MRRTALTIIIGVLLALPASADATFPGQNGKIAFHVTSGCCSGPASSIYTINPDGSGLAQVPNTQPGAERPAWAADGQRIAFASTSFCGSIFTMKPDGTEKLKVSTPPNCGYDDDDPTWSPDGTQVAYTTGGADLFKVNADGTETGHYRLVTSQFKEYLPVWSPDGRWIAFAGTDKITEGQSDIKKIKSNANPATLTNVTDRPEGNEYDPSWSPGGAKIAFILETGAGSLAQRQIYTINSDGSNLTQLTSDPSQKAEPVWSPDGTKVAFMVNNGTLNVMNADGSDPHPVPNVPARAGAPDWQPLPINGYPRPKGATPLITPLTVAYKPCTAPNSQHSAPLDVGSCNPPQQSSDYLTVGTLDANGEAAGAVGSVATAVKPGNAATPANEADVWFDVSITDVRNKTDLSDYTGEVLIGTSRRTTDKDNTPAPDGATGAATTQDAPLLFSVPCAATADDTIGSTCALLISANSFLPGQVKEGMRANWELSQIQVNDGGADGDAETFSDNTLFMDEGIFVP